MLSHNYQVAAKSASMADLQGHRDVYRSHYSDRGTDFYKWAPERRTLQQILQTEKLPIVVRLSDESVVCHKNTPVDLHRPILLFKEVKEKKLHARNIRAKTSTKEENRRFYQEVGPEIIIPQCFDGYFRPLHITDQPLLTVSNIARLMPELFLSHVPTEGYISLGKIGETTYQKSELPTGLYRLGSVLEETIKYLNRRKTEKTKRLRCISCENEQGKEVLFPMDGEGMFLVAKLGSKFPKSNIGSSHLYRVFKWGEFEPSRLRGFRVKLMHGTPPHQECKFTGLLEFKKVTEDHNVIGCTMTSAPRLFEMAVSSELYFNTALNDGISQTFALQQKCLKHVRSEGQPYMRGIKVRKDYAVEQPDLEDPEDVHMV